MESEPPPRASILRRTLASPYLLLTGSSLFWAGNFVVGRAIRGEISPIALSFWRWVIALLILLPFSFSLLRQHRAQLLAEWNLVALLGATGVAGFQAFSYQGLTLTTAINGLLLVTLTPIFIAALSWLLFRDRLTARQALGIVVSLLGALVVIARGNAAAVAAIRFNPGDLWMIGAVVLWAIYSVLLKRRPVSLPLFPLSVAAVIAGLLVLLPFYVAEVAARVPIVLDSQNLLALLYIGIFPSAVALNLWNKGVAAIGPNRAGMFLHLMPLFGAILAVLFLGERIALYHLVGALLVFAGIALTVGNAKLVSVPGRRVGSGQSG